MSGLKQIPQKLADLWKFITVDIWRISNTEVKGIKLTVYRLLKTVSLAIRRYDEDQIQRKASALTYSTLLSIVPALAIILAIANGFGFHNILKSQLSDYFPGQKAVLEQIFTWINLYMAQMKGGVFVGIGIILLLWTVINLISNIEICFNEIWLIKKNRSYYRKVTDYFSFMLLIPVFMICSSGLSILTSTAFNTLNEHELFTPLLGSLIKITPYILTVFLFTGLYIFLPNTKVKFKNAFYAGIFAGIAFQTFQYLYISGQIWVSKYNAIYGSFAALPLLLLWLQASWLICLLGVELAYAGQNIQDYEFEADSKNISRRYKDFITLSVLAIIIKRFELGEKPHTSHEISMNYKIPTRLVSAILFDLMELNLVNEVKDEDRGVIYYQPAMDINKITVGGLLEKIDSYGSENFNIDINKTLEKEWKTILKAKADMTMNNKCVLVKDISTLNELKSNML
jgi:membrane protein